MNRTVSFRSLLLGAIAGPVLACFVAGAFYYYPAQEAAVRRGTVADFALWPVVAIGCVGMSLGVGVSITLGDRPLPAVVKHISVGALLGVIAVVIVALAIGGPSGMTQAPHYRFARLYGVPATILVGGTVGFIHWRLQSRVKYCPTSHDQQ